MRCLLRRFAQGLVAICFLSGYAIAETAVDVPTAKALAGQMLANGQPAAARDILEALNRQHPDDVTVLLALSRAERDLGNFDTAAAYGRRAFRTAETDVAKFQAARFTAQALSADGKRTRAQLWLRRAGAHAPNARAEAVIRREYDYVRSRNPVSLSFDLSVTPSDNVNNAPTSNQLQIGSVIGIDPSAVPIKGVETWLSATLRYRLPATATRHMQFSIGYVGKRVDLGSEAATIDPTLRADDLAYDRFSLGWSGRFRPQWAPGTIDATVDLFRDDQGQSHLQNGVRVSAGHAWQLNPRNALRLGLSIEDLNRRDASVRSSQARQINLEWTHVRDTRDRLSLLFAHTGVDSSSALIARSETRIRASYSFAKPVLGTQLQLSADWRGAEYDDAFSAFFPIRSDDRLVLSASAALVNLDVYGFAPVIELRRERTRSNISSFDTRSTSLGIALRSTY